MSGLEVTKQMLLTTLEMLGEGKSVVTVHRPFIEFTGSLEAGMLLSQALHWWGIHVRELHRKGLDPEQDPGFYHTDSDWSVELCITPYLVGKARARLLEMGIMSTRLLKVNGAPTLHYRLHPHALLEAWAGYVRQRHPEVDFANLGNPFPKYGKSDSSNLGNPFPKNGKSIIEEAEITAEITREDSTTTLTAEDMGAGGDWKAYPWREAAQVFQQCFAPQQDCPTPTIQKQLWQAWSATKRVVAVIARCQELRKAGVKDCRPGQLFMDIPVLLGQAPATGPKTTAQPTVDDPNTTKSKLQQQLQLGKY